MEDKETPQIGFKDVLYMHQSELDKVRDKLHNTINEVTTLKLDIVKIYDKLDNPRPCALHVNSMKELNDGLNRIEIVNATNAGKLDGFIAMAKDLLLKHDTDLYKSEGLISTASSNKKQIALLWTILTAIFIAGGVMFIWKQ